jgi:ring-1,2-phenylacetyl-CoA epoxidase subunit PaaB
MKTISLDPRVNRLKLEDDTTEMQPLESSDMWPTYEVFHQKKRGAHHVHVGVVHAPNSEMAMVFAKEQYARRGESVNLWVVRSADIFASSYDDSDIFETVPEKHHREPGAYKVKDKLKAFKNRKNG